MKTQLETRLAELKVEFAAGQKNMTELQTKQNDLHAMLLRISGAIQVIEEELTKAGSPEPQKEFANA
jgi:hypothetical protein